MTLETLEKYVIDAERAFEEQLYLEGKSHLEEALALEPGYGKAHNHMGWLYLFHLKEYEKAERHLKLALKYSPNYSAPYIHMSHLLFDTGRLDEHENLMIRALDVPGVQKSFAYNEFGRLNEVRGNYRIATRYYGKAIRWSLDDQEIQVFKDNIRRVRSKRWMFMFSF